jgi:hypothetical protein
MQGCALPPLRVAFAAAAISMLVACGSDGPAGPGSAAITQFVEALRGRGYSVTVGGEISVANNGFFSVPARQIQVNAAQVNAFEYSTAERAGAEARLITRDADPSPTIHVSWVSRPQFYHQGALIVLYVGCQADVLRGLEATLGAPVATGTTPCLGGF